MRANEVGRVLDPSREMLSSVRRVAVLRALKLGDMLCAVPALRALRAGLPDAEVTLIGLPWAESFASRFAGFVDVFAEFPGFPGLPERAPVTTAIPAFLTSMQERKYDLAIQMQGSGEITNLLIATFGACRTAGFYRPSAFCPESRYFSPYPENEPEVRRNLALIERLGIPAVGEHLELPLFPRDLERLAMIEPAEALRGTDYVCVHAGSAAAFRRWPPEYFAAAADALARQGLQIVLTGTAGEAAVTATVRAAMRAPAIDFAGLTDLGALGALLAGARLLIANDTGVAHLADALAIPSVAIFLDSQVVRWAPLDRELHHVVAAPDLHDVSPAAVIGEAEAALAAASPSI
jgi:ADP-heptose:LPS heptosyltransferase